MKKVGLALLLVVVLACLGGFVVYSRMNEVYQGYDGESQEVIIPSGTSPRAIGESLVAAGVVRDALTYRVALALTGAARHLKAGEFRFDRPMTPRDVIDKIARGEFALVNITFREGLTIDEMAALFAAQGFGSAASFRAAASQVALVANVDPSATDLEGYLFPDTYAVSRHIDAPQMVQVMVERFFRALTSDLRTAATAKGLTVRQLVTLASIVEKETGSSAERPMVAAVYSNRLRIGMGLQCDPTVIYALQRAGKYDGNLRRDDLSFDSPYNTYRYSGLPPGPIAAPGGESLEAAAHPDDSDYIFFVSKNDGTHAFARSLDEHNQNVQKYQVQYFKDKRLAAQRAGAAPQAP
ncbi:MAG: endolytic transglycosylase MltG [Vicinamibacterales bacterium]